MTHCYWRNMLYSGENKITEKYARQKSNLKRNIMLPHLKHQKLHPESSCILLQPFGWKPTHSGLQIITKTIGCINQHLMNKRDFLIWLYLLDILSCFCRCFHENQPIFLCKLFSFFGANSPSVSKVAFVAYQYDRHVWICMVPCIFQPDGQVIKCLPPDKWGKKQLWEK